MQILIDTLSSLGVLDYSACVQYTKEAKISRRLNKPTSCKLSLFISDSSLPIPSVLASLRIISSSGLLVFTGYISEALEPRAIGQNNGQPLIALTLNAISDEILLDADQASTDMTLLGRSLQQTWEALTRFAATPLQVSVAEQVVASNRILVREGSRWSEAAETLAFQTGNSYRCIAGAVEASPVGQVVHAVAADDPGLSFKAVPISDTRWLARDVTICGREEPTAYATEIFVGDGSTSTFTLSQTPFAPARAQKTDLLDMFQGTSLNSKIWQVVDTSAHIALTGSGLTCNGGTGRDGEAIVSMWDQIELGGAITIEATGVTILPGSNGVMVGLYTGDVVLADCLAGYQVSSSAQSVILTAEIAGTSGGSAFILEPGHMYTLRLHVYSPEMERVRQSYVSTTSSGPITIGGELLSSAGQIVFEVQDTTNGVLGAVTVLFSGALTDLPPACVLGLINSGDLICSVRSVRCTQTGPLRVTVGSSISAQTPVSIATSAEGGACQVAMTGALKFYPATIPSVDELIVVSYRLKSVAVARQVLPSSQGEAILPSTLTWIGSVEEPIAWSSSDCDSVAAAMLGSVAAGLPVLAGSYSSLAGVDVWPGDILAIGPQADGSMLEAVVQTAAITLSPDVPEVYTSTSEFATPTVVGAGFKLSSAIPSGVLLPQGPTNIAGGLVSLSGMTVSGITGTSLTIVTGIMPPLNGGFEVRRRDLTFGPGIDSDLVLRTAATEVSIPRSSAVEQFYFRMYDGCQPANYSQFSAAVFLNVPLRS